MKVSPVGELINRAMREQGLTREQVVQLVAYHYLPKGLQMLDDLVSGKALAYRNTPMVRLPMVLGVTSEDFDAAMALNYRRIVEAREDYAARIYGIYNERTFRPHLWINSSRLKPTHGFPVTMVGVRYYKRVVLPEGLVQTDGTFDAEALGNLIRAHYREKEGKIQLFGDIISYNLIWKYNDPGIEFSINGLIVCT